MVIKTEWSLTKEHNQPGAVVDQVLKSRPICHGRLSIGRVGVRIQTRGGHGISKLGNILVIAIRQKQRNDLIWIPIKPRLNIRQVIRDWSRVLFEARRMAQGQGTEEPMCLGLDEADSGIQLISDADGLVVGWQRPNEGRVVRADEGDVGPDPVTEGCVAVALSEGGACEEGR